MNEKYELFDFEDGNGPVPAHRHPNGGGWVADTAHVEETAFVGKNARVFGRAVVNDNAVINHWAQVFGHAFITENAALLQEAQVFEFSEVRENALIRTKAKVYGYAEIYGNAKVFGHAEIYGNAGVYGDAVVRGHPIVAGYSEVSGNAMIGGNAELIDKDHISIGPIGSENGTLTVCVDPYGELIFNRGCFTGSAEEFGDAVHNKHGGTEIEKQYLAAIFFAANYLGKVVNERQEGLSK